MKAKACPHCGARRGRSSKWKWLGGGFLALAIVGAFSTPDKPRSAGTKELGASVQAAVPTGVKEKLPDKQTDFISLINDYKSRFASAGNEFQESALRDQRRAAILSAVGPQMRVQDWIGTLRQLETSIEGRGIITVQISPQVSVMTWNNSLTDAIYQTMIEKGTPSYAALMAMTVGDKVRFSGNFISAETDGVLEGSLTIRGAMTDPEFLFRFSDITKY